jgi:hypothetical protein
MAGVEARDFDSPDETRTPDKTKVEVVRMSGASVGRMRLEPGWRWSECIKPIVGGEKCQARHVGLLQSGTMHVAHDDGTEQEIRPGQAYVIEPGHDAWVVGDEPVVGFEFESQTGRAVREEFVAWRTACCHRRRQLTTRRVWPNGELKAPWRHVCGPVQGHREAVTRR